MHVYMYTTVYAKWYTTATKRHLRISVIYAHGVVHGNGEGIEIALYEFARCNQF